MRKNKSTCCFTGHRKISNPETVKEMLKIEVAGFIGAGFDRFLTGGAIGFDTICAQTVLDLREAYPHIRLILVLPCPEQSYKWSETDIKVYEEIKTSADEIIYISLEYTPECMYQRNRYLIENSDLCIAYLTKSHSGTSYTVNYAKQKEVQIINLAEKSPLYERDSLA